jgi:two-component system response regulator HydG
VNGKVLIVDDESAMCEMIAKHLKIRGCEFETCTSPAAALERIRTGDFDVVVTDVNMPGKSGIDLCKQAGEFRPDIPFIVMTAFGSLKTAVQAIRAGAFDFVTKPIEMELLMISMERAIEHRRLTEQIARLKNAVEIATGFGEIVGESPVMVKLYDQLARVTDSEISILLTGESGTGKELVARSIHGTSSRRDKPFVAVNCGALPEALIESELFGHAKGSFTDAKSDRKGLFQEAHGGTIFLDEIGELPLPMQVKLLRALEERKARPVGGNQELPFDVRVLSATNLDLENAIEEGTFREDLYYRINVIQLNLPPLRARGTDILQLAQLFLDRFSQRAGKQINGIAANAAAKLLAYSWPGNVRELRNVIERAVALTRYDTITIDDLPEKILDYRDDRLTLGGTDPGELTTLEDVERRYIEHVLKTVGNNKTVAAQILGLDRTTLYRKLAQYKDKTAVAE